MKKNKQSKSLEKLDPELAAAAVTPSRAPEKHYRGARPGYSLEEVSGNRTFRSDEDFVDDLDDEERRSEKLTQAGVDDISDRADFSRDDTIRRDREFELTHLEEDEEDLEFSEEQDLEENDENGLRQLDRVAPLKAERTL